jgi:hypothetical protein
MRIRFGFGALTLDTELLDTPTAKAIAKALPIASAVLGPLRESEPGGNAPSS